MPLTWTMEGLSPSPRGALKGFRKERCLGVWRACVLTWHFPHSQREAVTHVSL